MRKVSILRNVKNALDKKKLQAEDDLIAAILRVKPTPDMPTGKAKAKPKKKSGKQTAA